MSENHEERIAALEKKNGELLNILRILGDLVVNGSRATLQIESAFAESILGITNVQYATGRYLASLPAMGDTAFRQQFLDIISKGETNNDTLSAMLATAQAKLNGSPLLPPLPPAPGGPSAPPGS